MADALSSSDRGAWKPSSATFRRRHHPRRGSVELSSRQEYRAVWVYNGNKSHKNAEQDQCSDGDDDDDELEFKGVWASKVPQHTNPTEVWVFEQEHAPAQLEGSTTLYGYWGYEYDYNVTTLMVYPPIASVPRNFNVRGVWIYPQIKADTSHMAPGEVGFLEVVKSPKLHKLDIAGSWKIHFKKQEKKPKSAELTIFQIKLDRGDGNFLALFPVKKTDTVRETREKLVKKDPKLPSDQCLVHHGEVLQDDKTLQTYDIGHGSVVELEGMKLYVHDWDKNVLEIPVEPNDTIYKVKQQISNLNQVPITMLRLSFEKSLLSKDDGELQRYGVYHHATIRLEPLQLKIQQTNKDEVVVAVRPVDSIRQVKQRISQRGAISIKPPRRLVFNGTELKDNKKLTDYDNIEHGSTLNLVMMQVFIHHWSGDVYELDIRPDATVADVKVLLWKMQGIPIAHQNLYFNKTGSLESAKQVSDYQITHGATISLLSLAPIEIIITGPDDDDADTGLIVDPTDLIQGLKEEVEHEMSIQVEAQQLFFDGMLLEGSLCLAEYGIVDGSKIQIKIPWLNFIASGVDAKTQIWYKGFIWIPQ